MFSDRQMTTRVASLHSKCIRTLRQQTWQYCQSLSSVLYFFKDPLSFSVPNYQLAGDHTQVNTAKIEWVLFPNLKKWVLKIAKFTNDVIEIVFSIYREEKSKSWSNEFSLCETYTVTLPETNNTLHSFLMRISIKVLKSCEKQKWQQP